MALPALISTEKSTNQATHLPTHSLNWSILLDRDNKESILTPGKITTVDCKKNEIGIRHILGKLIAALSDPDFGNILKTLNEMDILNYFKSFREKWEQC
jgi:hypothetical protein